MQDHSADLWEAIYYPNPIPLSTRSLLSAALLFDRLHFPGVSIPQVTLGTSEKAALENEARHALSKNSQNLLLWALEKPAFGDFIHLPDQDLDRWNVRDSRLAQLTRDLLDSTYGDGLSDKVESMVGTELAPYVGTKGSFMAHVWPLYQSRAIQYAHESKLPLVSDDQNYVPPFPRHPQVRWSTRDLAQQLAFEAVSIALPPFISVRPVQVAEFRSEIQPVVKPFRLEMVKLTAELATAIASDTSEDDLKAYCRALVESKVLPRVDELRAELAGPLRPWHKVVLEVTEIGVATAASTSAPALTFAWALFRGGKLLSKYATAFQEREGRRRSPLSYLLKLSDWAQCNQSRISAWDKRDWRCSGSVYAPDPDGKLNDENQAIFADPEISKAIQPFPMLRIEQTTTMRVVHSKPRQPKE